MKPRRYPSLAQAVGLLVVALVLQAVVSAGISIVFAEEGYAVWREPGLWGVMNLLALSPIIGFAWARSGAGRDTFPFAPFPWFTLIPMILFLLGMAIVISELDNLTRLVIGPPPDALDVSWIFAGEDRSLLALLFPLVLVAPLTEELLFRGIVLRGFLSRYATPKAVALSALLFALFHLNPWQFLGAFILGAVFGWWYVKCGSLVPCLVGHAIVNGFPVIVSFVFPPIQGFSTPLTDTVQFQPFLFDVMGLVLTGFGFVWLRRELRL